MYMTVKHAFMFFLQLLFGNNFSNCDVYRPAFHRSVVNIKKSLPP